MLKGTTSHTAPIRTGRRGLTLVELLVVITIIGVLMGLLLPGLRRARNLATRTECLSGLHQIGLAIFTYALENDDSIPYGPKAPPPSATNFYPQTGNVTSLISLENGAPVGLGLLLDDDLVGRQDLLFCPGADDKWNTRASLLQVGIGQVESSYYYRHASVASLSGPLPLPRTKLHQLGDNRNEVPIRCLAFDTQFIAPPQMVLFNLRTRTHHRRRVVNALFTDGHASTHDNDADRFTVELSMSAYDTLERILELFEALDERW